MWKMVLLESWPLVLWYQDSYISFGRRNAFSATITALSLIFPTVFQVESNSETAYICMILDHLVEVVRSWRGCPL
jgi:hypothetical protein